MQHQQSKTILFTLLIRLSSIVASINQHGSKITHPILIVINYALPCIVFTLGDTPSNTHLMRMLIDTGAATNTGSKT